MASTPGPVLHRHLRVNKCYNSVQQGVQFRRLDSPKQLMIGPKLTSNLVIIVIYHIPIEML